MAVKFKVGFTMSAETLFSIIAKFLPIEDLQVEEIEPSRPLKVAKPARLIGADPRRANRHTGPMLEGGVNKVILDALEDGRVHRYSALKKAVGAAGYAGSGIGSKLGRLRELNLIHQPDVGLWQIGEAPATKKAATG